MDPIEKLTELFREFPGIGPRQGKRFAYFLVKKSEGYRRALSEQILELKNAVRICESCFRYFSTASQSHLCSICINPNRERETLMILSQDVDLENLERSHSFKGLYFVLGGTLPILEKEPEKKIRINELKRKIEQGTGELKEIILAMNLTAEGENTEDFLKQELGEYCTEQSIKLSVLGRGLSTGTELEYSDSETLKNALQNRH